MLRWCGNYDPNNSGFGEKFKRGRLPGEFSVVQ